jgi:hypothetical protein
MFYCKPGFTGLNNHGNYLLSFPVLKEWKNVYRFPHCSYVSPLFAVTELWQVFRFIIENYEHET